MSVRGLSKSGIALASVALTVACTGWSRSSAADEPPAAPSEPAPPATPPDVVRLLTGAMYRGTISEMDPDGDVEIVLMSGETRTFRMSVVEYAGPASDLPRETPPPHDEPAASTYDAHDTRSVRPMVTVHGDEAQVHFTSKQKDLTLHWRSAAAVGTGGTASGYERVCSAPCDASLPAGKYTLALSEGNSVPVEASKPVRLTPGENIVQGTYSSYADLRAIGWVGFAGGLLIGAALASAHDRNDSDTATALPYMLIGGSFLFIPLTFVEDDAEITVRRGWGADEARRSLTPAGPGLRPQVDRASPLARRGLAVRLMF